MRRFFSLILVLVVSMMFSVSCSTGAVSPSGENVPESLAKELKNSAGMKFVLIEPATFLMGSPVDEPDRYHDEARHEVTISKPYYIQTTEVTQAQWKQIMGSIPAQPNDCSNCPVVNVSWDDIQVFLEKLNGVEAAGGYRLPYEAEWEYASRAGATTAFANGQIEKIQCGNDPTLNAMGWYCGNSSGKVHPVAQKEPNAWKIYDMHGNVWEWCHDNYSYYPTRSITDPTGPDQGDLKVLRGGSWISFSVMCRSAARGWNARSDGFEHVGFRVVLEP